MQITTTSEIHAIALEIVTSSDGIQSVDARQLHQFLESNTRFNDWITKRIREFEFLEGHDFSLTQKKVSGNNAVTKDYTLSLSMAKELSMVERSEKGKKARLYFIACEEVLKQVATKPLTPIEVARNYLASLERVEVLEAKIAIDAPKVNFHDTVMASESVCQMAVACQTAQLPFGRNTLYQKLREKGVLIEGGNRHNLPTQQYVDRGLFVVKEQSFEHPKTGEPFVSFTTYCTQKGLDWIIKNFA
jgi:phage anti-repressor protein/phage antirepressor YoqD-like protein